jgi:N-acetyl-anhydromuramyl-L-alanine amidase AmpD
MLQPLLRIPRLAIASALLLTGCAPGLRIVDRPISFSLERVEMTRAYIQSHYGLSPADIRIVPRIIVLHWTAIDDLEASFRAFDRETLAGRPDLDSAGHVNVSIQFLVDRDGSIYRLMPETHMARHVIGLNYSAIGVENVGGAGGVDNLTDAQIKANVRLVRYLAKKYSTIQHLIGHSEYRVLERSPLWLEREPGYRTTKIDPGDRFMRAVRAGVADLKLRGPDGAPGAATPGQP